MADGPAAADSVSAARALAATLVEALETRLDLAATELAQERLHLARQCIEAALALWALTVGVLLAALALAWAGAPEHRALVLAALGGVFVGAGAVAGWRCRERARRKPPLLDATRQALRADAAALRPGAADPSLDPGGRAP